MRIRSYYSDNEIIPNLYTFGGEWQLQDGTEYKGLYHKYIPTDEIYTEGTWKIDKSVKLIEFTKIPAEVKLYKKIKTDIKIGTQSIIPLTTAYKPSADDYATGYITRYFLKKYNQSLIYEVDDIQYFNHLNNIIDVHLYIGAIVKWYITGETVDTINGTIKTPGVITKNKQSLKEAEKQLIGISRLVTNLTQYYTDTDYIVPADINKK
jgi:hypothetical protein